MTIMIARDRGLLEINNILMLKAIKRLKSGQKWDISFGST